VRALVRPTSERRNLEGMPVEFRIGELEDAGSLREAMRGVSHLLHVAADYRLWVRDPQAMFRANLGGTRALMEAALAERVERVVYTSSVATLGTTGGDAPADEEAPSRLGDMVGPYKQSKFQAEEAVRRMVRERGLPAVIVNPSTPVGPGDVKPTPTGRLIVEAAAGRMPGFVDTGLNIVHVDDVAEGHVRALAQGRIGERYILGGEDLRLAEILGEIALLTGRRPPRLRLPIQPLVPVAYAAEMVARLTGNEPFVTRDGLRMAEKKMYFSSAKAERELGYAPRPAREALADAVAWFSAAGYLR
jgi:dihydroflavonol-4-reductase